MPAWNLYRSGPLPWKERPPERIRRTERRPLRHGSVRLWQRHIEWPLPLAASHPLYSRYQMTALSAPCNPSRKETQQQFLSTAVIFRPRAVKSGNIMSRGNIHIFFPSYLGRTKYKDLVLKKEVGSKVS